MGDRIVHTVVVLLLISSLFWVQPASATSCIDDDARGFERGPDGHWYVLHSNGKVHEYDHSWTRVATIERDLLAHTETFAPASGDGWWVVTVQGNVTRAGHDWTESGPGRPLVRPVEYTYPAVDVDRHGERWWVLTEQRVYAYNESWGAPTFTAEIEGDPSGMAVVDRTLWTVSVEGTVRQYRITDTGTVVTEAVHETVTGRELDHPTDVARTGDGDWILLSMGGGTARYSDSWEFTGVRDGRANHDFGCISLQPFLNLLWIGGYWMAIALGLGTAAVTVEPKRLVGGYLVVGVGGTVLANSVYNFQVPEVFTGLYRLPEPAVNVILAGVIALEAAVLLYYQDDVSPLDMVALVLVNSPLLAVVLRF